METFTTWNLGPLTTTISLPASCAIITVYGDSQYSTLSLWGSAFVHAPCQISETFGSDCLLPTYNRFDTKLPEVVVSLHYSPGLACPNGYTTVNTGVQDTSQTWAVCCPSGYSVVKDANVGVSSIATSLCRCCDTPASVQISFCGEGTTQNIVAGTSQAFVMPTGPLAHSAGTISDYFVWLSANAPTVRLVWESKDLSDPLSTAWETFTYNWDPDLPPCATACGKLYNAVGACQPLVATADQTVYDSCFCNDPGLTAFRTGTTGVCDNACTADAGGLASIQSWYTSWCHVSGAASASATTTTTSTVPSTVRTSTATESGSSTGISSTTSSGGLKSHFPAGAIAGIVVGILALGVIAAGAVCYKRRRQSRLRANGTVGVETNLEGGVASSGKPEMEGSPGHAAMPGAIAEALYDKGELDAPRGGEEGNKEAHQSRREGESGFVHELGESEPRLAELSAAAERTGTAQHEAETRPQGRSRVPAPWESWHDVYGSVAEGSSVPSAPMPGEAPVARSPVRTGAEVEEPAPPARQIDPDEESKRLRLRQIEEEAVRIRERLRLQELEEEAQRLREELGQ